jgi:hypothetical protein
MAEASKKSYNTETGKEAHEPVLNLGPGYNREK